MNTRVDFLEESTDNITDHGFKPKSQTGSPLPKAALDQISREAGFPSRQAPPVKMSRQRYTGRNVQLNAKVHIDVHTRFYELAERLNEPLGAVLERAVTALEKELSDSAPD